MKLCPLCKNSYEDWVEFCFQDGYPLVVQAAAAPAVAPPAPAPSQPTQAAPRSALSSAPAMDSSSSADWDAFDAPEPTLIRMQKLKAADLAAQIPPPAARPNIPVSRPTESIEPASVAPTAPVQPSPIPTAYPSVAPKLNRPDEPLSRAKPVETAPGITAVPAEELEPSPTAEVLKAAARSAESPAPVDDLDFPRPQSEDNKATVPMHTPQAADREEEEEERGGAAPAAVGISLAMLAAIGLGAIGLVVVGLIYWQSQQPTVVAPPKTPVAVKAEPVVKPPPPVEPPVVEPPVVEPPVVEPPVVETPVTTPPATVTSQPTTKPPTTTVTKPPATTTKVPAPTTSPWGTATTPTTPTSPTATSDNPWGAADTASTGTLRITSDPTGAAVYVDDKPIGTTPASTELSYGKHRVRLSLAGHRTESSDVSLNVKEMSVPFRLTAEQQNGIINVFGPTGASVWIDDHDMGPLPVSVQVREGLHTLKLVQADGTSCSNSRDVRFSGGGRPLAINLSACQ